MKFVAIFGFPGTEKLSACLLHVQNVRALIGINQKEPNRPALQMERDSGEETKFSV